MKLKKILLGATLASLGAFALASCGKSTKRNQVTPYGDLNSKLDTTIASADGDLKMTVGQYYTQLRKNGYSVVTNAINKEIYKTELELIKGIYENETKADFINNLGKDKLQLLEYTDEEGDSKTKQEKLYDLTSDTEKANEKYLAIRKKLIKTINSSIFGTIFSSSSAKAYDSLTDKEKTSSIERYVDTVAKEGIIITPADIKVNTATTLFTKDDDLYELSSDTLKKLQPKVDEILLTQARYQAGRKDLYKIADEEYIYDEESKDDIKNSNYLFKETSIKTRYENKYKKYGEYKAIIIQFNSRKEAIDTIQALKNDPNPVDFNNINNLEDAKDAYFRLYNKYYGYKTVDSIDSDEFRYVVNSDKDDLSNLSASISTLIKDTLKNGEYLTEPRNISNKYVMALHISTKYDYNTGDETKQADISDFSDEQKAEVYAKIKEDILNDESSYAATVDKERYEDAKIEIYDPLFEYNFYNSYSSNYELIKSDVSKSDKNIFKIGDYTYSVMDFYADASKKYATQILTNFFELEFANTYYDTYVSLNLIEDDLADTNKDTLNTEISNFKNNKNTSYPKEIGLETYLLAAYGYTTKEDVLKYYYNASKALSTYKDMKIYDSWRSETTNDDSVYTLSESAKTSFLKNILETGNNKYNDLFSINLDHFLINIDDDADGSPDDPDTFLKDKNDEEIADFENAVVELARAIYGEAINTKYSKSTLLETLKYIKTQYEEGSIMRTPYTFQDSTTVDNWDDFKNHNKYNFLLTVEALASDSDITEESVNNFVKPFKEYVENLYKSVTSLGDADTYKKKKTSGDGYEYENGKFFLLDTETKTGSFATEASDASKINNATLCKTTFGYHVLVINSYENQKYLTYTSDDASEYQQNIELTLRTYTDSDDNTQTIKLNISSLNEPDVEGEECTSASFNQFFIYYIQKANGQATSLDSSIYDIMAKLFDDAISMYSNSNFQDYLLLKQLNIKVTDDTNVISDDYIASNILSLKNAVLDYDKDSKYLTWVDGTTYDWTRPEIKK